MGYYPFNPHRVQYMQAENGSIAVLRQRFIAHFTVTPIAASANGVHAAVTQPTTGTTVVTTAITNPDVARNLSIVGNQSTCTGNVVIAGTNMAGQAITETIAASGTATVVGAKAFKTVTSITIPTRGAASDTIAIGLGSKLGLPHKLTMNTVLAAALAAVREATAPTVVASASALESNTVLLSSALDGGAVDVYYLV